MEFILRLLKNTFSLFKPKYPDTEIGEKLEKINTLFEAILDDLSSSINTDLQKKSADGKMWNLKNRNHGMSAESVLRVAILQSMNNWTFDQLKEHCDDSLATRAFLSLEPGQVSWSRSCLHENISAISEDTWSKIHDMTLQEAQTRGIEKGRMVRIDSTVVDSNIHHPTDSSLLKDCIRILWFILSLLRKKGKSEFKKVYLGVAWKEVKKIHLEIVNAKNEEERREPYRRLVFLAKEALNRMEKLTDTLKSYADLDSKKINRKTDEALQVLELLPKIIWQTEMRVFKGRTVPATKKIISIFEEHSDIIVKGRRKTEFGHKIFLTSGKSGLVTGVLIERGNPSDSELFIPLIRQQEKAYGRPPRQISADGGFASVKNVSNAKTLGISDVAFSKRCGLEVKEMTKSQWVFNKLRNFRAGIEGNISTLKRAYGLSKAMWKGFDGFRKYVISSIVGYNLSKLALLIK